MSTEFWVQIVVYAISLGSFGGVVLTRLSYLEKSMNKHNDLVEKVACCQRDIKTAFAFIDELKGAKK